MVPLKDYVDRGLSNSDCVAAAFERMGADSCDCPYCGHVGKKYALKKAAHRLACPQCGWQISPFSMTVLADSKIPYMSWLYAASLLSHGCSAKEIQRQIGVTYKTAWRMVDLIAVNMDFFSLHERFFPNTLAEPTPIVYGAITIDPSRCRIVQLQVCHLDNPDPMDCRMENLAALCQSCHNKYDGLRRGVTRKIGRLNETG
ncbi:MAG: transposase [Aeromonas sp.]